MLLNEKVYLNNDLDVILVDFLSFLDKHDFFIKYFVYHLLFFYLIDIHAKQFFDVSVSYLLNFLLVRQEFF